MLAFFLIVLVTDLSFMMNENVHIYLHLYLNRVIFSSRNSVNIMLISIAVSRYSLHCQWKQILILCAATVGKFVGLSDSPTFQFLRNHFSNCSNHSVENHLLGPYKSLHNGWEHKHSWKILSPAISAMTLKSHIIFWQAFWHIVCLLFWRLFWLGYLRSIRSIR